MPSALDRKFDAVLAVVTGPGRRVQLGKDAAGRTIVTNLPPTLPGLFDAFCALHADTVAVIAGDERLTFADLNREATRLARALVANFGIAKGDRVGIAMRNAPAWILSYMAVLKAGGVATLINGWWMPDELRHALDLSAPRLVIADAPRAKRIEDSGRPVPCVVLPVERPVAEALAPLLEGGGDAHVDKVAVVSAPPDVQRARVLARPGMTEARLQSILFRQMPDADKRARADYVIDTNVSIHETRGQVCRIVAELTGPLA